MNLVFSNDAIRDLRELSRFTRNIYGKAQASWYLGQIELSCSALASGRFRGRAAGHVSSGLFKQRVESYFIFFRREGDDLIIVRVVHEAMDHDAYF